MMVKAHGNCTFFGVQFSGVLAIFVGKKQRKDGAVDCKSLHESKRCLTSLKKIMM